MYGKVALALTIAAACTLTGTAAATPAPSTQGGTVHIIDYTNDDGAVTTAVLTGAIGDLGQGDSVNPDGTLSPEHTELNLVLSQGTFRIDIADLVKKFVTAAGNATWQHGPKSCSGYMKTSDSAPIIAGSGTGDYRGITGTFHMTMTGAEVDAPTTAGQCNVTGAFLSQIIVTEGTATVSY